MASLAYHSATTTTTLKHHQPTSLLLKNPCYFLPFIPSSTTESQKIPFRISSELAPKARLVARRKETVPVQQLQRPLVEYMSLPASQYSVLDAERIERVDENTFRCYVYRLKFFSFEVCPVLLVRVEELRDGCCIKLLSCKHLFSREKIVFNRLGTLLKEYRENLTHWLQHANLRSVKSSLEGSPIVVAQNDKFQGMTLIWYGNAASMVNRISCGSEQSNLGMQQLISDAVIEVSIDVPFPFRAIPVEMIESNGARVLEQILMIMLPRFMAQLVKDYQAWASGDTSRQPLGTGQI